MFLLLFIVGCFLGSFLGVLVDRLPRAETVIKGRSYCEFCHKELGWLDLIPVLSFIFTKGKCRYCKHALSIFYPAIELSTGILFVLTYLFAVATFQSLITSPLTLITLIYNLLVVSGFIVIFFMDLKYGIILDKILLPLIAIITLFLVLFNPQTLLINLACGISVFLFFLIIAFGFKLIRGKEGMGGGDIKLAFALGLFLGFPNVVIALYVAFLTGAFAGFILILWKKKNLKNTSLPFGPFLILGALICLFWGNLILPKLLLFLGLT